MQLARWMLDEMFDKINNLVRIELLLIRLFQVQLKMLMKKWMTMLLLHSLSWNGSDFGPPICTRWPFVPQFITGYGGYNGG